MLVGRDRVEGLARDTLGAGGDFSGVEGFAGAAGGAVGVPSSARADAANVEQAMKVNATMGTGMRMGAPWLE
jgi:hypothetical protein